jgi:hypothetical protein
MLHAVVPCSCCGVALAHRCPFRYAEELFCGLLDEVQRRDERVRTAQQNLESVKSRVPDVDLHAEGAKPWDFHSMFEQEYEADAEESYIDIFSQSNRPADLRRTFDACEPPPDFSVLQPFAAVDRITGQQTNLDAK